MTRTRNVWANRRRETVLGGIQPHLPQGTSYQFARVDLATALSAFDAVLEDPGFFALETEAGSRIDFHFSRGMLGLRLGGLLGRPLRTASLEIWFEHEPEVLLEDTCDLPIDQARAVIQDVYQDLDDGELWKTVLRRAGVHS